MDELPVYYGGDLWNPDGSDFGYSDYFDDQAELSDFEDPRDFFRNEWLGLCEFHAPDRSYFAVPEVGKASSPVSGYTPGFDMEVLVTLVRLQQDSGDASVSAVDITSGPEVDFLDPLAVRIRGMHLFWRWMLLPVRKLTFWTPSPCCQDSGDESVLAVDVTKLTFWTPPPLLSGSRGAANPSLSDVLRAGKRIAVRSLANFGR